MMSNSRWGFVVWGMTWSSPLLWLPLVGAWKCGLAMAGLAGGDGNNRKNAGHPTGWENNIAVQGGWSRGRDALSARFTIVQRSLA